MLKEETISIRRHRKTNLFNSYHSLPPEDRDMVLYVCKTMIFKKGSTIECEDEKNQACFYIVLKGMVREYFNDNGREQTRAFHCENDFFGWHTNEDSSINVVYEALEPVIVYRITRKAWLALLDISPFILSMWLNFLEQQIYHSIKWQEVLYKMSAADFFQLLQQSKPALWRKMRLHAAMKYLHN